MIRATIEVVVPQQIKKQVVRTLLALIGPVSAEPGCRGCRLFHDFFQNSRLVFSSEWGSRGSLESHIDSENFKTVLSVIDLSSELPAIRFEEIRQTQGMEYLVSVRGGASC